MPRPDKVETSAQNEPVDSVTKESQTAGGDNGEIEETETERERMMAGEGRRQERKD